MSDHHLGRRDFLKKFAAGAAAAGLAPILAACGGSASVASSSGNAPAASSAAAKPSSAAPASSAAASTKPAASGSSSAKPAASPSNAASTAAKLGGSISMIQWSHFVPAYDDWFGKFAQDWGKKNNVQVKVDHAAIEDLPARAAAEVSAKSGHDIFGFFQQGEAYLFEKNLTDVSDVANNLAKQGGGYIPMAESLGKVNGAWRVVPDFFIPFLSLYRKDIMEKIGWTKGKLETWDDLLQFGTKSKAAGNPVGSGLGSNNGDAEATWRSLMWCYGAYETDKTGKVVSIDSPETRTALEFAKKLYTNAMTPEVLSWDTSGNNRYLASGKGAWIYNPVSAIRSIENDKSQQQKDLAKNIYIGQPLAGPKGQVDSPQWVTYGIWNWSKNVSAAKAFITDLKLNFKDAFTASQGYNMPFEVNYNKPPMPVLSADPKYAVIVGVEKTVQAIGFPGPNSPAASEALAQHTITDMFGDYAGGKMSLDASIAKASKALKAIHDKVG